MASRAETVAAILEAAGEGAGAPVRSRAMFGEHASYLGDVVVALVCRDELFLKPTEAGRALLPGAEEAPPYPGARPHLRVGGEVWEEPGRLGPLLAATAAELPPPKPKRRKP